MTTRPLIRVTRRLPEAVEDALRERFAVELSADDRPLDGSELQLALGRCDGLLTTVTDRITAEVLAANPLRARILANFGVGYDNIDLAAARAHDITVTNTPGVLTDATADLAMMLILMVMRRAGEGERQLRAGEWRGWTPTHLMGHEVAHRTLGIIGMGRIGQAVAHRAAHGFGMRIIYYTHGAVDAAVTGHIGAEPRTLDALLAEADVVSLHCPSTDATRGMINAARIGLMKRGSFLVNTARGDVVNDDDLVAALGSGHLGGVGLDVFRGEPHVDRRYLDFENAVLLPHLGSATIETREAMGFRALANLTAFFDRTAVPDRVA